MIVTGGSTNVTTYFQMRLLAGGDATGLTISTFDMSYTRSGAATAAKVDAAAHAAAGDAHTDGEAIEVDPTDCPGLYRFDWPDAAFAAGVREVILTIKQTTCFTESLRVEIDPFGAGGVGLTEAGGDGDHLTAINLPNQTMDIVGNITGNLSGSVGSVTGLTASNLDATISSRMPTTHIAATAGKVDGVALVDTTTANTDMRGTDDAALASALTTAQADLDILTGTDGATLATSQPNYAPATQASVDALENLSAAEAEAAADAALATYDGPTNTEMVAAFTQIKGATWATTDTLEAIRNRGDAAWVTATGFATHSAADVWAVATRLLTAGTNIVLAKGTGVTGFNDLSAAQVNAEADTAIADYDGPTRTEATADKDEILAAVPAVADILTTQMTESYAADGTAPTLAQALFMLQQQLGDFAISGTTLTVKKIDGSTTAATFTLNDATEPTALARTG